VDEEETEESTTEVCDGMSETVKSFSGSEYILDTKDCSYTNDAGVVFIGDFPDGELTGQGKATLPSGTAMKGEFEDGCLINGEMRAFKDGEIDYIFAGQRKVINGECVLFQGETKYISLKTTEYIENAVVRGFSNEYGTYFSCEDGDCSDGKELLICDPPDEKCW